MCEECGCGQHPPTEQMEEPDCIDEIAIGRSVQEANDAIADRIRNRLRHDGILSVNIMGAPGSGKTTVIENMARFLNPADIAVIQGDLESDIDTNRLAKRNIQACQINTHSGCHLDAAMISNALLETDLSGKRYLLIENVGNLVCPAGMKIGQHINVVVISTPEGSDKPAKYPLIFMDADMVLISKTDLSASVDFDEEQFIAAIRRINAKVRICRVASKDPDSFKEAAYFLEHERAHLTGTGHSHDSM